MSGPASDAVRECKERLKSAVMKHAADQPIPEGGPDGNPCGLCAYVDLAAWALLSALDAAADGREGKRCPCGQNNIGKPCDGYRESTILRGTCRYCLHAHPCHAPAREEETR